MRVLLAILLASCATPTTMAPKGGPRGLRASEHLDVARGHDDAARDATRWPSAGSTASGEISFTPWFRSWDTTTEHERLAQVHRSKAAALQAVFAEECGPEASADIAVSPLQRYGTGGWNTSTGVIVYLSRAAGDPERLLAALKCHRAWMMLAPTDMDDCPLDLPGLQLDARGDGEGVTLSISVRDPALVPELQRRTAHDLEAAVRPHAHAAH
ncbi:MAG: hypothetical protein SFX73_27215 [Kofleriaceae bacterium]|nr:hypothetical protein [Kofleriaceae bacterium]